MNRLTYLLGSLFTLLFTSGLYAEGEPAPAPGGQGFTQTLVMIGIALIFFYFILWRPEQKRRRTMEDQRGSMKKGDRVTAMGIIGTMVRVKKLLSSSKWSMDQRSNS